MTIRSTIILTLTTAAVTLAPCPALAKNAPAPAEIQLLQPGDSKLTCEALATEINSLTVAEAQPAKKKKKFGLGGLGKALSMASPMLMMGGMGGGGIGGQLVAQAAGTAQQAAMESQMQGQMDAAVDAMNPVQSVAAQRKARLMNFYETKNC